MRISIVGFICLLDVFLVGSSAAQPLTPGDIVVAVGFTDQSTPVFAEYTPSGTLVQSYAITVPSNTSSNAISGITVGPNSTPYVFAGEFQPQLWTVNPSTGVTSTQTVSGWATDGSLANGSLAAGGNYIYASSENNANSTGGVFRFDLSGKPTQHFFDPNPIAPAGNTSYDKVAIGYNGGFYGLLDNGGYSSPYIAKANASTGTNFAQMTLSESVNALGADANGNLYVVRGGGTGDGFDEFSPTGALMRSYNVPDSVFGAVPTNIELSQNGDILASSYNGNIVLTSTAFNSYTTFSVSGLAPQSEEVIWTAAAFVQPPVPLPEPNAALIAVVTCLPLLRRRTRAGEPWANTRRPA